MSTEVVVYEGLPDQAEMLIQLAIGSLNSKKTAAVYRSDMRAFLTFWYETGSYPSLASALDAWKQMLLGKGYKPSYINRKLAAVRKLFNVMVREGYLDAAELARIEQVSNVTEHGSKTGHWLNEEEQRALIALPDITTKKGIRDRAILSLFLACGLRKFELCKLTWGDIQEHQGVLAIFNLQGKHNRVRTLPIAADAAEHLMAYRRLLEEDRSVTKSDRVFVTIRANETWGEADKGISSVGVWKIIKEYAKALDHADLAVHDLRRSAAQRLKEKKGIEQTRQFLGHSSILVTERYLDTAMDFEGIAEAMEFD